MIKNILKLVVTVVWFIIVVVGLILLLIWNHQGNESIAVM